VVRVHGRPCRSAPLPGRDRALAEGGIRARVAATCRLDVQGRRTDRRIQKLFRSTRAVPSRVAQAQRRWASSEHARAGARPGAAVPGGGRPKHAVSEQDWKTADAAEGRRGPGAGGKAQIAAELQLGTHDRGAITAMIGAGQKDIGASRSGKTGCWRCAAGGPISSAIRCRAECSATAGRRRRQVLARRSTRLVEITLADAAPTPRGQHQLVDNPWTKRRDPVIRGEVPNPQGCQGGQLSTPRAGDPAGGVLRVPQKAWCRLPGAAVLVVNDRNRRRRAGGAGRLVGQDYGIIEKGRNRGPGHQDG